MTYHFEKTIGELTLRYDLTFDATCPVEWKRFTDLRAEWENRPAIAASSRCVCLHPTATCPKHGNAYERQATL